MRYLAYESKSRQHSHNIHFMIGTTNLSTWNLRASLDNTTFRIGHNRLSTGNLNVSLAILNLELAILDSALGI